MCIRDRFTSAGLRFGRIRNKNGGLSVTDRYGFYVDLDTAKLIPDSAPPRFRTATLPHCQPDMIGVATHRESCEVLQSTCLPVHQIEFQGHSLPIPKDEDAYLELKYPNWRVPKKLDKGSDTTPWDSFKAQIWVITECYYLCAVLTRVVLVDFPVLCVLVPFALVGVLIAHWVHQNSQRKVV
eukprot:TRINITY_DN9311_c0_g1_i2.p1 TRINITY_DN9311_c0_g1~~TRINITY_DN9311_c0_g1_i2.p1  ORF type:complete len:182 (+),score=16.57 TRINITY_DN9311_c0_g1_i2:165-710(+)